MDEWLLSAIKSDLGGDVYDRILQLDKQRTSMADIPFDVLLLIICQVSTKDVFNVMRVNKRWHRATQDNRFWKALSERHLIMQIRRNESSANYCYTKRFEREMLRYIDMSVFEDCYNKDVLYSYLFKQGLADLRIRVWPFVEWRVIPRYREYIDLKFEISFNGKEWKCYAKKLEFGDRKTGIQSEIILSTKETHGMRRWNKIYDRGRFERSFGNEWIAPEGHYFKGDFYKEEQVPHGKGKWVFTDGTTLTGDNVAFAGKPHGKGKEGEVEYFAGEPVRKKQRTRE